MINSYDIETYNNQNKFIPFTVGVYFNKKFNFFYKNNDFTDCIQNSII